MTDASGWRKENGPRSSGEVPTERVPQTAPLTKHGHGCSLLAHRRPGTMTHLVTGSPQAWHHDPLGRWVDPVALAILPELQVLGMPIARKGTHRTGRCEQE